MSDVEHAGTYARALLGDHEAFGDDEFLIVWTLPDRRTQRVRPGDPDALAAAITAASSRAEAVFVGMATGPAQTDPDDTGRPGIDRVLSLLGVWCDVDVAGEHHTSRRYPPTKDDAAALIAELPVPPTVLYDSGHGLIAQWLFHEPWRLSSDAEREQAKTLAWSWVTTIRLRAATRGWDVDPVTDIARVLRAPGTLNRKSTPHLPVRVLEHNELARYNPDDLLAYCATAADLREFSRPVQLINDGVLRGVDVAAVFARVMSSSYRKVRWMPEWLELVAEEEERLDPILNGRRPDLNDDGSRYDAALVAVLAEHNLAPELICEAVMCRRLRSGDKPEKADPAQRLDYLARTVGRFMAAARERIEARRDDLHERIAAATATLSTDGDNAVDPPQLEAGPAGDEPRADEEVDDPDGSDDPDDEPAAEENAPLSEDRAVALAELTGYLGLPKGYVVRVAKRRDTRKGSDLRIGIMRTPDSPAIRGLVSWVEGTLRWTEWHPIAQWDAPSTVKAHLRRDVGLFVEIARGWSKDGLPALYAAIEDVIDHTPRTAVRHGLGDLMVQLPPLAPLSEALRDGHPWLVADPSGGEGGEEGRGPLDVRVPVPVLRRHLNALGSHSAFTPEDIVRAAQGLGAPVQWSLSHLEPGGLITDPRVWITVPHNLIKPEQWTAIRKSVRHWRDARAEAGLRVVARRELA